MRFRCFFGEGRGASDHLMSAEVARRRLAWNHRHPGASRRFGSTPLPGACGGTTSSYRSPKPVAVLASLVAQAGQVVTKEALLETVWPATVVTEGVLKGCIRQIRRALGETGTTQQYIATVHRRGYRFVAPVTVIDPSERRGTGAPLQREAPAPTSQKAGQAVPNGLRLPGEMARPSFSRYANRLPTPLPRSLGVPRKVPPDASSYGARRYGC